MRTIKFKTVFDRIVRWHGRDPRQPISSDLSNALVDHINERVGTICTGWLWPEWVVTEERAFRPVWSVTEQYLKESTTDGLPDEVFYLGDSYVVGGDFGDDYGYYRVLDDAVTDPPVGTVPTDTDYWEAIDPLDTFVAYDQRDRRAIGMVLNVYGQNPRVPTGSMSGSQRFTPSEKGIDVPGGGTTVFITHKMPCPTYTITPYVAGKIYVRGDVIFNPTDGECYQAIRSTLAVPADVGETDDWNWVPFLEAWSGFVTNGAFADSLMEFDQGGNAELQAKMVLWQAANDRADTQFQLQVDKLVVQGQELKWNFCKRNYWSESETCVSGLVTLTS